MARFGFHASHEQLAPSALLEAVRQAEEAGFAAAMCSDHFAPWSNAQGHSGYAWSWLGAALARTGLPFGVVSAPGQRYHPAVAAQKAATLCEMFPGRFWMALGSGEALNEHITGDRWPPKEERNARLLECVEVMRALFAGECVTHDGLVTVDRARLYTLPESPPPLVGAAVSAETARWAGSWADGLITVNQDVPRLRRVIEAFREGGGEGKPIYLQVHLSWAEDDETALRIAHEQWRTGLFGGDVAWNLETPDAFEQAATSVRPEDVRKSVLVSADLERQAGWLAELAGLGFDALYLHHVGQEQRPFIDAFGEKVLPQLAEPS
ncbi:TIGR03885 family FMN-dependent LLM class oxidoreductase [Nonomuraea sp. MCN248]|uniref:TIGR03885 family FMN-dependent LLM class oxidoreductase n=1 Tax=Nonomuraea corallina TaxID=2989783 RepID=A0ABT4SBJ9_9ACTN|nr:TIGR03885 family FMN-dependent LLM class oxidoreductase [Nonomuraea corallina]MDA0634582.1 TIGR03885 family FMN-dependent LLM class oxidoreductase [Nonomuraea corallina]